MEKVEKVRCEWCNKVIEPGGAHCKAFSHIYCSWGCYQESQRRGWISCIKAKWYNFWRHVDMFISDNWD